MGIYNLRFVIKSFIKRLSNLKTNDWKIKKGSTSLKAKIEFLKHIIRLQHNNLGFLL